MRRFVKIGLSTLLFFTALFLLPFGKNSAEAATPASGVWGNQNWTLTSNGTLTISGNGPMTGFSQSSKEAWHKYSNDITTVVIENGVTNVGEFAFESCRMTNVTIPSSITSIEDCAFMQCENLTEPTIPKSVTHIGSSAFESCASLKKLYIPSSVTTIGDSAFADSGLESITLPSGLKVIEDATFLWCRSLTRISIPLGVTKIGESAFSGCSLWNVYIPTVVSSIGDFAFYSCSELTSVTIPVSVKQIGRYAFEGSKLTNVDYGGTAAQWNQISIDGNGNDKLTSATVHFASSSSTGSGTWGNLNWSLNSDGVLTITGNSAMSDFGASGTSTDAWRAYKSQIKHVHISSGVTSIGEHAFYNCDQLETVSLPNGLNRIGSGAFDWCPKLSSIQIPSSVTYVGDAAFASSGLTYITFPGALFTSGQVIQYLHIPQ